MACPFSFAEALIEETIFLRCPSNTWSIADTSATVIPTHNNYFGVDERRLPRIPFPTPMDPRLGQPPSGCTEKHGSQGMGAIHFLTPAQQKFISDYIAARNVEVEAELKAENPRHNTKPFLWYLAAVDFEPLITSEPMPIRGSMTPEIFAADEISVSFVIRRASRREHGPIQLTEAFPRFGINRKKKNGGRMSEREQSEESVARKTVSMTIRETKDKSESDMSSGEELEIPEP